MLYQVHAEVLKFAMSEHVRTQDARTVLGSVAGGSNIGRKTAWKFFKDNLGEFKNR